MRAGRGIWIFTVITENAAAASPQKPKYDASLNDYNVRLPFHTNFLNVAYYKYLVVNGANELCSIYLSSKQARG